MSVAAKATLAASIAISVGTVFYVHYKQTVDREKLHEGVLKDIERQQKRKVENLYALQQQIDFTKEIRKQTE